MPQRSFQDALIVRLVLKVAVRGTYQCDFVIVCESLVLSIGRFFGARIRECDNASAAFALDRLHIGFRMDHIDLRPNHKNVVARLTPELPWHYCGGRVSSCATQRG